MAASEGNEYTLGEIAGEGSFAEVFRAKDKHGNTVAVKRARVPLGYFGEATMTKAMKEFTTVKRLGEHPNIIQFLDIFKDSQGRLCIAMELAVGGSAKARMERKWGGDGRDDATVEFIFLPGDVAAVALDIASGLKFIHDQGLAHGDLKPGNIVFNAEGRALLADFGSAKLITEALSGQSGSTTSSTKEYDAPERLRFSPTSTASDIWSLGATLLELLTGCGALAKNPSTQQVRSDAAFCFAKGLEVDWSFSAALKALNVGPLAAWEAADQGLKDLIASCLVVDPGKRPTAAALLDTPLLRARRLEREQAELKELKALKALAAERALAVEKAEARAAEAEANLAEEVKKRVAVKVPRGSYITSKSALDAHSVYFVCFLFFASSPSRLGLLVPRVGHVPRTDRSLVLLFQFSSMSLLLKFTTFLFLFMEPCLTTLFLVPAHTCSLCRLVLRQAVAAQLSGRGRAEEPAPPKVTARSALARVNTSRVMSELLTTFFSHRLFHRT